MRFQRLAIQRRIDRGEQLIGLKMGFTSVAKMEQMGVHDMIWGRLTDSMLIENGGKAALSKYIHPPRRTRDLFSNFKRY